MKKPRKTKKNRLSQLGKLGFLIFALWSVMTLISLQGQINEAKARAAESEEALAAQRLRNTMLQEDIVSDSLAERYTRKARSMGFVYPGELIIIDKTP
jgi:cell division protein FtsL